MEYSQDKYSPQVSFMQIHSIFKMVFEMHMMEDDERTTEKQPSTNYLNQAAFLVSWKLGKCSMVKNVITQSYVLY